MRWAEISIQTSHEATEAVADIFHELGASGVLIEDPELVNNYIHSGAWDYTDIPLAEETEIVTVKAWLPTDESLPNKLEQLRLHIDEISRYLDKNVGVIDCSEIQDEDWANNWKAYFHPEKIGDKIVVKPSWEEYTPADGEMVIELDPGMAFGTGTHATTSMCIQFLEEYIEPQKNMQIFDVGTGSGILAIAASKLGAKAVQAADYDDVAVKVAVENVEKNHETEKISVFQSDLLKNMTGKADFIIANIIADIIIRMFNSDVDSRLNPHGAILTSGIIADRIGDVTKAAQENGFVVEEMREKAGWAAIVFRRKEDMQDTEVQEDTK